MIFQTSCGWLQNPKWPRSAIISYRNVQVALHQFILIDVLIARWGMAPEPYSPAHSSTAGAIADHMVCPTMANTASAITAWLTPQWNQRIQVKGVNMCSVTLYITVNV